MILQGLILILYIVQDSLKVFCQWLSLMLEFFVKIKQSWQLCLAIVHVAGMDHQSQTNNDFTKKNIKKAIKEAITETYKFH